MPQSRAMLHLTHTAKGKKGLFGEVKTYQISNFSFIRIIMRFASAVITSDYNNPILTTLFIIRKTYQVDRVIQVVWVLYMWL